MKLWTKCLITLFVLALASSSVMAADLHWLFFDNIRAGMKEAVEENKAQAILEQAQAELQMPSSELEQTKQPEPLQSLSEESLESEAEETGYEGLSEDAVIAAVEDAIKQMEYAYEVKDEAFVIVSAQYEAQGIDYNALKADYNNLQEAYKKSIDPFDLFILPEAEYTFGEDTWTGSLSLGFIYNNIMFSMGVEKRNIESFDSFKNPYGYSMKMGVGIVF